MSRAAARALSAIRRRRSYTGIFICCVIWTWFNFHHSQRIEYLYADTLAQEIRDQKSWSKGESPVSPPKSPVSPPKTRGSMATGILIGITASRATFPTRVAEVMRTWARKIPPGVFIRVYVGDPVEPLPYPTGSQKDISNLAKQANISDRSIISVMPGIRDDEYPLVSKAASVLKFMDEASVELMRNAQSIDWFYDVDDDTYVSMDALQEFLGRITHNSHLYVGQGGRGAPKDRKMLEAGGLTKPFCMGGPGILMAKQTFRALVDNIDNCIVDANKTLTTLFDDVVFGMCLQKMLGIGCGEGADYKQDVFAHNYGNKPDFPGDADIWRTVSVHPHKIPGMMTRVHERFETLLGEERAKARAASSAKDRTTAETEEKF